MLTHVTDPWKHLLEDEESEKKWGFRLNASLTQATEKSLLQGFKVSATKKVVPPHDQLKGKTINLRVFINDVTQIGG